MVDGRYDLIVSDFVFPHLGRDPGGDEIRVSLGLVKEIVAGVLFPSGLG